MNELKIWIRNDMKLKKANLLPNHGQLNVVVRKPVGDCREDRHDVTKVPQTGVEVFNNMPQIQNCPVLLTLKHMAIIGMKVCLSPKTIQNGLTNSSLCCSSCIVGFLSLLFYIN